MNSDRKKLLRDMYKAKPVIGGVCCIRCSGDQRVFLQATTNIEGLRNRFNFAMSTRTSPDPSLQSEWEKYGSDSFAFSVLDELKKGEEQSDREFANDINALYDIWMEKAEKGELA